MNNETYWPDNIKSIVSNAQGETERSWAIAILNGLENIGLVKQQFKTTYMGYSDRLIRVIINAPSGGSYGDWAEAVLNALNELGSLNKPPQIQCCWNCGEEQNND